MKLYCLCTFVFGFLNIEALDIRPNVNALSQLATSNKMLAALNFIYTRLSDIEPLKNSAVDNLVIEELSGGVTNYCFKCFDKDEPQRAVFIKHATDYIRGLGKVSLTSERLRYENDGMKAYAKYCPSFVPKIYLYDDKLKYLVNEWLEGYKPLVSALIEGHLGGECSRSMGTLMGRSHARTHRLLVPEKVETYSVLFSNKEHFDMWSISLFKPVTELLHKLATSADISSIVRAEADSGCGRDLVELLAELDEGKGKGGFMRRNIASLQHTYLNKKEVGSTYRCRVVHCSASLCAL